MFLDSVPITSDTPSKSRSLKLLPLFFLFNQIIVTVVIVAAVIELKIRTLPLVNLLIVEWIQMDVIELNEE